MLLYIARRVAAGLVLALLVTFITFLLLSFSFDGVVRSILGSSANDESVTALKSSFGMDRPLIVQYLEWLGGALLGDFGTSYFTSEPVGPAVAQRLSVTLSVVLVALAITVVLSVTLGVVSAVRGGLIDRFAQGVSLFGVVFPGLLLAIVLVVVFAVTLRWLPATGFTPFAENPARWAATITIPVIVLVIAGTANMAAQIRGAMIDELRKDYVRTLRTRGYGTTAIVLRHALRNAAGPALTVLGFEFIAMLGGALIIEKVFALPGYGTFAFASALRGDIPVVMGITAFGVLLVVLINLAIDVVNGWLRPKARLY
jgi:peptide/nickel transport system permease protein